MHLHGNEELCLDLCAILFDVVTIAVFLLQPTINEVRSILSAQSCSPI